MTNIIEEKPVSNIPDFIKEVLDFKSDENCTTYFRGESEDFEATALQPSIYRKANHLKNEHHIYREMQRFNDYEFTEDKSTVDKLSRMQHYLLPTRLIDLSEDALTALYFAVEARTKCEDAVVYVVAIENKKIKYYDSDTVSVIANLAKSPLGSSHDKDVKSKYAIAKDAKNASERRDRISNYNECESTKFLLHDIKEDKGYFSNLIDPKHIFSIQFVKPKLTNTRIYGQKGAFLLFGLNIDNVEKHIPIIEYNNKKPYLLDNVLIQHPIKKILKIKINCSINLEELRKIGITKPYIYTGLDKISEHLKDIYK